MAVSALVSMGHEPNALLAHLERELSMPNTKSDPFASMPPLELLEQAQVLAGREGQDPHQVDLLLHHLQVQVPPSCLPPLADSVASTTCARSPPKPHVSPHLALTPYLRPFARR